MTSMTSRPRLRKAVFAMCAVATATLVVALLSGDFAPSDELLTQDVKSVKVVDAADVHGKTTSNEQKQVINEEALIKEAVHEAMTKVVAQASGIVRHAVQSAVSRAVGEVREGSLVAKKLVEASQQGQVDEAAQAEKAELSHISTELSKQLGGVISDFPVKHASSENHELDAKSPKKENTLTYKEVKENDPDVTKGQYRWLKWVQSEMQGLSSGKDQENAAKDLLRLTEGSKKGNKKGSKKGASHVKQPRVHPRRGRQVVSTSKVHAGAPLSSKHNVKYVAGEEKRDDEAEKDMMALQKVKKATKGAKKKFGLHEISDATINKELALLDKRRQKDAVKRAAIAKRVKENRDAQAEKYLEALKKSDPQVAEGKVHEWKEKMVPVTSRKNPAYMDSEKMRDLEAKVDMRMLKKGSVLIDKHNKMEAVKLAAVVVHGQDKLAKERAAVVKTKEAVRAASHQRSEIAEKDLDELKKQPAIGTPFHKIILSDNLLHPHKDNMNTKASQDLKALKEHVKEEAEAHHQHLIKHVNQNELAQTYLHDLEKHVGVIKASSKGHEAKNAEQLAQDDLKNLSSKGQPKAKQ